MISENDLWGEPRKCDRGERERREREKGEREGRERREREREQTQNTKNNHLFNNSYIITYIQTTTHPSSSFHQNLSLKVVVDQDYSSTQSQTLH